MRTVRNGMVNKRALKLTPFLYREFFYVKYSC